MTSDIAPPRQAYVWIWLPGAMEPVVAGRLSAAGDRYHFLYGRSYRERDEAIPIYEPELPLGPGPIAPPTGLQMAAGSSHRVIWAARDGVVRPSTL